MVGLQGQRQSHTMKLLGTQRVKDQMNRWVEYFVELLNRPVPKDSHQISNPWLDNSRTHLKKK